VSMRAELKVWAWAWALGDWTYQESSTWKEAMIGRRGRGRGRDGDGLAVGGRDGGRGGGGRYGGLLLAAEHARHHKVDQHPLQDGAEPAACLSLLLVVRSCRSRCGRHGASAGWMDGSERERGSKQQQRRRAMTRRERTVLSKAIVRLAPLSFPYGVSSLWQWSDAEVCFTLRVLRIS